MIPKSTWGLPTVDIISYGTGVCLGQCVSRRGRVVGPCLFWIECLGAEVRRPTVCAPLRNGLPVGKANSALHIGSRWLQVRVMLGS